MSRIKRCLFLLNMIYGSFITVSTLTAQNLSLPPSKQLNNYLSIQFQVTDYHQFITWQKTCLPQLKTHLLSPQHTILETSDVTRVELKQLLQCPYVKFIDRKLGVPQEEASFDRRGFWLNKINVVHQKYPQLNGDGLFVSVKERPFDINDIDLRGRIADTVGVGKDVSNHATTMASLIAGGGNTSPNGLGVAWKARLYSNSFDTLLPTSGSSLIKKGIYVQNHSYGVGKVENYYGLEAQAYDQQGINFPQILHVFSSGNSGNLADKQGVYQGIIGFANITGQFKTSKNTLSVGETDSNNQVTILGSRGPAYDGRIKPELVAFGGAGTSESAALVSGIGVLVQQAYQNKYKQIPSASLVKAVLINTADDLGRTAVDFEYGFGSVDALGAINTIEQSRFSSHTLTQKEAGKTLKITLPANARQLKVTLVWNDPPAAPNNVRALVNDLDLTVKNTASGTVWKPWILNTFAHKDSLELPAKRGEDHLNNVEQVTVSFPEAGEYEINIKASRLTSHQQAFSIAYEYPQGFEWIFPLKTDVLQATRIRRIQWEWNKAAISGKLEFKEVNSNQWQTIANIADLSQEHFNWTIPDIFAQIQIRLSAHNGFSFTTETITIMHPLSPKVGYDCPEELMLFWTPLKGVTSYQVYKLGTRFLEPVATVQDTLVVFKKSKNTGRYFAVAPILQNLPQRLGNTTNLDFSGVSCYFKSFLLKSNLTDTIQLALNLATNFHLAKIELQRRGSPAQTYQTIQTFLPNTTKFTLKDASPLPYRNMYRVALTNTSGQVFYSNELNALTVAQQELFAFPNPISANEILQITDRRQAIEKVSITSITGKILQAYTPNGSTQKEIPIPSLRPGVYLVQLILTDGSKQVKRIIVK